MKGKNMETLMKGKTMNKTIYLAGPVGGLTEEEAKGWRKQFADDLKFYAEVKGISPLRAEPPTDGSYDIQNSANSGDECWGSPRAVASKNYFDVTHCDIVVAYLPSKSLGTVVEMAWAFEMGKSVILVSDVPDIADHPLLMRCASWIVPTLEDAMVICTGMMGDY